MKTTKPALLLSLIIICFVFVMPDRLFAKSRIVSGSTIRKLEKPAPKKVASKRISVNFKNNDIRKVFKKLEPYCGCTYVLDQTIQGKVTLRIKRASCERIVEIILARHNLKAVNEGGIVRVFSATKAEKKEPEITKKPIVVAEPEKVAPQKQTTVHKERQKPKKQKTTDSIRKFYIGLSGIYSVQLIDDEETKDKFTGDPNISFDDSFGIQLKGGYVFNPFFSSEVVADYLFPYEASLDNGKDELNVANFSINGKVSYPFLPTFKFYGIAGVGYLNAYEDISYNGETNQTNDWGASLRFGAGVDISLTPNVLTAIETAYSMGLGNVDHISYLTLSIGVRHLF